MVDGAGLAAGAGSDASGSSGRCASELKASIVGFTSSDSDGAGFVAVVLLADSLVDGCRFGAIFQG